MTETDSTVWQRLLDDMPESIARDSYNDHNRYSFVSIDKFVSVVGPVLRRHGVMPIIDEVSCDVLDVKGKPRMMYGFRCGLSWCGAVPVVWERLTVLVLDPSPQAAGQARAYAYRIWLSKLFGIDTGETAPDLDSGGPQPAKAPVKKAVKKAPVKKAVKKAVKPARTETQKVIAAKRQVLEWVGGDRDLAASVWETGGGTLAGAKTALGDHMAKVAEREKVNTPSGTVTYAPGEEPF